MENIKQTELLTILDLQFFAEGDADTGTDNKEADTSSETDEKKDEVLTPESVAKMIQSEVDKIRTQYTKALKDKEKEIENIKTEQMTDEQKKAHEFEKIQEELSTFKKKALEGDATTFLAKQSLPVELTPFVLGDNTEVIESNVTALKAIFDKAVQDHVNGVFKDRATEHKGGQTTTITKADFDKMDYSQRIALYNSNSTLYAELTK